MSEVQEIKQLGQMAVSPVNTAATPPINDNKDLKVENGSKKPMDMLKFAGVIAAGTLLTCGAIYAHKKINTKKLEDVVFKNGAASLKEGGEKFSGKIKDKLKNGDNIELIYKDGVLQKSKRKGEQNFTKVFDYNDKGKLTKVIKDGVETAFEHGAKDTVTKTQENIREDLVEKGFEQYEKGAKEALERHKEIMEYLEDIK